MTEKQTIKIGAGPLATGSETNNIWIEIGKKNPDLAFQFIPCACSLGDFNEFLGGIGNVFDVVSSIYDENLLREYNLQALELDITPLKLSVPITHPLIKNDHLSLSDLNNQTIVLPQKGKFACFDQAREFLYQNSTITIQDVPGLNMNVFNHALLIIGSFVRRKIGKLLIPSYKPKQLIGLVVFLLELFIVKILLL